MENKQKCNMERTDFTYNIFFYKFVYQIKILNSWTGYSIRYADDTFVMRLNKLYLPLDI